MTVREVVWIRTRINSPARHHTQRHKRHKRDSHFILTGRVILFPSFYDILVCYTMQEGSSEPDIEWREKGVLLSDAKNPDDSINSILCLSFVFDLIRFDLMRGEKKLVVLPDVVKQSLFVSMRVCMFFARSCHSISWIGDTMLVGNRISRCSCLQTKERKRRRK